MLDILVHATQYRDWAPSTRYAAQLAGALHASLTAAWCESPAEAAFADDMSALMPLATVAPASHVGPARAVASGFTSWAASLGAVSPEWLVCEVPPFGAVRRLARWHDLVVLGNGRETPWSSESALAELMVAMQAPCLVVPEEGHADFRLHCVAIAWNASVAAAAAVHDAIAVLARAERVVVLSGARSPNAASREPRFELSRYLERHGVRAEFLELDDAVSGSAGELLLQEAGSVQADLMIMGAFGRSRLSEWALGGVSRYMLAHSPIPLLMRH